MDIRQAIVEVIEDHEEVYSFAIPDDTSVGVVAVAKKLDLDLQSAEFRELVEDAVERGDITVGGAFITNWSRRRRKENLIYLSTGQPVFTVRIVVR